MLLTRLLAGSVFLIVGWAKIQNPFGWMGPDGFAPGFLQALAALSEFGGGIALILGLLTPLASFGLFCTMVVAAGFHLSLGDPLVNMTGGGAAYPAAMFGCIALLIISLGPGRMSLDRVIFGVRRARLTDETVQA
ncbi:MAG: DoxX family protein [Planctomycetota bacterium]